MHLFESSNLFLVPTFHTRRRGNGGGSGGGNGSGGTGNAELETEDGKLFTTEDNKALETET